MARINFVVPQMSSNSFSGGLWCVLEYARGLVARGHDVTIVPILPSVYPKWFPHPIGKVITSRSSERLCAALRSIIRAGCSSVLNASTSKIYVKQAAESICLLRAGLFTEPMRSGISEAYVMSIAPEADITVATGFQTARAAALLGGRKFYFAQHYEPYFCDECENPSYAANVARQSYRIGLNMIANSSWLRAKLQSEFGNLPVSLCPNAIDHQVFKGSPKPLNCARRIAVISYGGRNAEWKGFRTMAEGVAIARKMLPEYEIEWRVYGDALVKPDVITPYTPLGFLSPSRLSEEYRRADMLLSASWYESFPLFPIEAMACGLPVITTQYGTEEYAIHGSTAEIVQPKSPQSIANGLIRLIEDRDYRQRIATGGNDKAREFNWTISVGRLENILLGRSQDA